MEENSSSLKDPVHSCLRDLLSFMSFWVVIALHEDEEWFPSQLDTFLDGPWVIGLSQGKEGK